MNQKVLKIIQSQLKKASQPIKLVAITKYTDSKTIQSLVDAGVEAIGENRVEVAEEKLSQLPVSLHFEKHFVGQIQSKKIRQIVQLFDVIQSVSSNRHLLKIDQIAEELNKPVQVFLQFNLSAMLKAGISEELQKSGYAIDDFESVKDALEQIQYIEVVGLMGMASQSADEQVIRNQFKALRELRDELQQEFPSIKELSMGMSNDYRIAIEEGATVVRIGRRIL